MAIVQTNINYTYEKMIKDIESLKTSYSFIQTESIGFSVLKRPIPVIRLGQGKKAVFYSGAFHGNEWITSVLLMKFIEDYCNAFVENKTLFGYRIQNLFYSTSIYIAPMVNPDGVDLVTRFFPTNSPVYTRCRKIARLYPNIPFPDGWKANFNGVGLKNYQPVHMNTYLLKKISLYSRIF